MVASATLTKSNTEDVWWVTMALLECPPPWNSMVPKASVGLSCVCLQIDHFSNRLSFLANRSSLSFWLVDIPGGKPTCWPIRRPQQHLRGGNQSARQATFKAHGHVIFCRVKLRNMLMDPITLTCIVAPMCSSPPCVWYWLGACEAFQGKDEFTLTSIQVKHCCEQSRPKEEIWGRRCSRALRPAV